MVTGAARLSGRTNGATNMKNSWDRAFAAYGAATCRKAWELYCKGWGARSIALEGVAGFKTTRQADAAIDAWEAYLLAQAIPTRGEDVALAIRALDRAAKEAMKAMRTTQLLGPRKSL